MNDQDPTERESSAGGHFYGLYKDCGRKFFLKYILGFRPSKTSKPLIFGSVIHDTIKNYYLTYDRDIEETVTHFLTELLKREHDFLLEEDFTQCHLLGPAYLREWDTTWKDFDQKTYDLVEVEQPYELKIGPNEEYIFTVRPDRVFREKTTKRYVIFDTKTTGWSAGGTFRSVDAQDQMTSYIWAVNKIHPEWKVTDAIPDIIFGRPSKVPGRIPTITATRPGEIYRDTYTQAQFEIGMFGTILEISQKVDNLTEYPAEMLFPRNGSSCAKFGCEYIDICRTKINPQNVPITFVRDEWIEELTALKNIKPLPEGVFK